MPRSFLVKKHLSYKKPNYGELDSKEKEDHKPPYSPGESIEACPVPCTLHPPEGWMYGSLAMATAETPPKTDAIAAPQIDAGPQRIEFPQESHPPEPSFPRPVALEGSLSGPLPLETRPFALREEPGGVSTAFFGLSPGNQGRVQCFDCHHEAYLAFPGLARRRPPLTLQPLADCDWLCHKYFSCKYCDKEYVSLGALKMHIRTHTLPCVCHLCGKAFSRPWLLQGHIRTHTGEKPFSCPHCSRAFADRSNLRAHLQTHSDVKKYQCKGCSKTFSRISLLSKHEEAGCCPLS